jgi:hypothetical protein
MLMTAVIITVTIKLFLEFNYVWKEGGRRRGEEERKVDM